MGAVFFRGGWFSLSKFLRCEWGHVLRLGGPAEHLGRLASCPPSAVFVPLRSGWFCTQPPPFTYAIHPKCSAGLVVIKALGSQRPFGIPVASELKLTRLQTICRMRKQLQIHEQTDAYCKLYSTRRTLHAARCTLHTTHRIPFFVPRPTMPSRQY